MTFSYNYDPEADKADLIPIDTRCTAQITDHKFKAAGENGTDRETLSLEFKVIEGQFAGTPIWVNMHFKGVSPKAINIAKSTMNKILTALGKNGFTDPQELCFKKMWITIKHTKATENYPSKEDIKKFEMHEETKLLLNAQANQPTQAVQNVAEQMGGTVVNTTPTQNTQETPQAPNWNGDQSWQNQEEI